MACILVALSVENQGITTEGRCKSVEVKCSPHLEVSTHNVRTSDSDQNLARIAPKVDAKPMYG